ncbi:MAG: GntR family transcriptional regulator [Acidobacteria bacterium]|nr:GntR family transcriptional regulator [Acidobacteriota bacterium]
MITIDTESSTPLVDQVADELRYAIATGQLRPGDALPPVRQLATDLRIHFNTVARAYRALEAEGLLRSARGRGTRVTAARTSGAVPTDPSLQAAFRDALTKARLVGMNRTLVEQLLGDEVERLWSGASPASGVER